MTYKVKSLITASVSSFKCVRSWRWSWMSLFNFTTRSHSATLSLAIVFAFLASSITPIFAILLGEIFNSFTLFGGGQLSNDGLLQDVARNGIGLAGLGVASWILNGVYFTLFIIFGELQVSNARITLFEGLLERDQEWFETQKDGTKAHLSYLQAQIQELQMATSQPLGLVIQFAFRTLISLGLAFYTSWSLSLITLAGIPVFSSLVALVSSRMKRSIEAQQDELTHASKVANSATSSIDTVKCLNGQEFELRKFAEKIDNAAAHYLKQARLNSLQIAIIRLMMFGMFVQGFWYGTTLATSGRLTAGEVLRAFWACLTAAQSIEMVLPQVIVLEKGKVAASMLKELLNGSKIKKRAESIKGALYPRYCKGDIEVSNLSFTYSSQPDRPILKSTSFFFPAGETTFVIGESGSGKSTLGQLLARLYMPTSGEILIDGVAQQTLSINWIRNNITLVEQRSVLFNESVFTNIAFGRRAYDTVTKEDVRDCIDLAMLGSTIGNLPSGLDTCVGNGGSFLSGGQRQRVAIARARLRDTPILIMDEPTSALDGINRNAVMKAVREWRRGKTTIIITHDMSQIMDHDYVYALEHGSVTQAGYRYELKNSPAKEKYFPFTDKKDVDEAFKTAELKEVRGLCSDTDSIETTGSHHGAETPTHSTEAPDGYEILRPMDRKIRIQQKRGSGSKNNRPKLRGMSYDEENWTSQGYEIPMRELNAKPHRSTTSRQTHYGHAASKRSISQRKARARRQSAEVSHSARNSTIIAKGQRLSLTQTLRTLIPSLTVWQRLLLLLGVVCTLLHACATPIFSYCLSQLFRSFYDTTNNSMRWSLVVLGVAIGDGTVSYFMHYLLELCGQAWVDCLRKRAFQRVLDQPRQWFDEEGNSASRLTACLDQNGEDMRNLVGRFGGFVLVAVAITLTAVIWCLVVCWKLTLVALACGPVIYVITRGFEKTSGLWQGRCNEVNRVASDVFIELFSEIRTVRTLTLESFFHRKYLKAASKCMEVCLKRAVHTGALFGLVESTIIFVTALIFYYGALLVSSGYTVINVTTVFSILLFSIGYASTVLSWIPQISSSQEMASQLLRLVNLPAGLPHEHIGNKYVLKAAPVNIRNLNFRYPSRPDAQVLRDVSLNFPQNSCTAIAGGSGSGKSTIASLLLSLYEAPLSKNGRPTISLGGLDIRHLHTPSLRSLIAVVSQQPTIFPGTILSNICYGLDDDSPLRRLHNVRAAAQAAGIDDFFSSLPNDYFTVIGDGGVGLSGGQAQRLVIARALVRRPQVLILDEATSSLDPENANLIRRTVQNLVSARSGLTVIIISHARDMIEIADNVVVLEQGSVVEQGPYDDLAKRPSGKLNALIRLGDTGAF
ncbi:ABC transporter ATP-binding protein [Aspergillus clavatus NRRL 1]|uniref:ABC a-pheromone efflux pump AtrD n=1 Tax=Aspergillus clavatus (strain ATCC 1007 / CBS 513.65 / DSM 816 / NCTC 3887 / NRRL 1 / QM 1276 / 107) TaxID=344612 RepID=A1CHJ0_ASPCL|nr:ABC a-pheromone efflux pump AtrD [Aspergillus clavatus NRRL 1]EAW10345.1 ABC a-pheromone efflux pump AtrD [Aspergillus clavatus NRRL 1]